MSNFLHVDINSYFATVLQQENPHLRGRPVGVVKELGRTCIIAASKEAKKLGVKTGCGVREARRLAPQMLFVPAAFSTYLHTTKVLQEIFRSYAPEPEIYSLDEAFLDVRGCALLYPDLPALARRIQDSVRSRLGEWVSCNVGIGKTRFLAKLASEVAPKGSVFEITPENRWQVFAETPFADVCGVGVRLERRLAEIGVTNLLLLSMCSREELERCVGPWWAKELRAMICDEEVQLLTRINKPGHMKSVGRSITGWKLCNSEQEIRRILRNLTEEVTFKCRRMKLAGRQVSVALWGSWNTSSGASHAGGWGKPAVQAPFWSAFRTLKEPIQQASEMFSLIQEFCAGRAERFPVIKFAVGLSLLEQWDPEPQPLFPKDARRLAAAHAVDAVNERFGLFTVRPASLLGPVIRPEVTGFLGDKKYYLG